MASAKVRQLEDGLAFRYVADSDRPSNIENMETVLLRNQERALKESHELHGTIGPNPNYDEEGNIIPQELWAPDLSFTPIATAPSLKKTATILKDLIKEGASNEVLKSLWFLPNRMIQKLTSTKPSKALKKLGEEGRETALEEIGSRSSFERLRNTLYEKPGIKAMDDMNIAEEYSGILDDQYKVYKRLMESEIKAAPLEKLSLYDMVMRRGVRGSAYSSSKNPATKVKLREFGYNPDDIKSTALHEFGHIARLQSKRGARELEYLADELRFGEYRPTGQMSYGPIHNFANALAGWEAQYADKISPFLREGKKITHPDIGITLKRGQKGYQQQYLLQPLEMVERASQIRQLQYKPNKSIREEYLLEQLIEKELKLVTKEGLDMMVDKLWMAAPISVGLDEDLFKEVKE